MQTFVEMKCDAAAYATERLHLEVRAPRSCPNCRTAGSLEAHGYYERWASDLTGKPVRIAVRRFFAGIAK